MKLVRLHTWTNDLKEAARIQENLANFVDLNLPKKEIELIAGADVAYSKKDNAVFASIVVMNYPELTPLEKVKAQSYTDFPYVPGFLTFREGPVLVKALERVQRVPDLILFDGNGIAHPKGIGLATHLGVILDLPTIGCAKKKLLGNHHEVPDEFGAHVPLEHEDKQIGAVVRTRVGVKPLFVSAGNKIGLEEALDLVISATRGYRLPEPQRLAHVLVNKMRRNYDNRKKVNRGHYKNRNKQRQIR